MAFYFKGRSFTPTSDRLKLTAPLVTPASSGGAGLIGLCRPASSRQKPFGFEEAGGAGGWSIGRAGAVSSNPDRLGLYRMLRVPVSMGGAGTTGNTATTAAFTPPAYCTLIAFTAHRDTVNPATSSCTTSGLTWTLIPGADIATNDGTAFCRMRAFSTVISGSPASMTVGTTSTGSDQTGIAVIAVEGGGTDFSNIAVNSATGGNVTATLPSAPNSGSMVLGAFQDRNFSSIITPPSGYSQIYFGNVGTNGKLQVLTEDNTTAPALAWTTNGSNVVLGLALEMRHAPVIEHSSAVWVDGRTQGFLAYSASASEHYLALDSAASLERSTTAIALDTTDAVIAGRWDIAAPRGGFDGDLYWLGVLKALPPAGLLDQVLRQLAPPTTLRPWLAHLIPIEGRAIEKCVLSGASLVVDSGTTVATSTVSQPQERRWRKKLTPTAGARWRARLEVSYGGDNVVSSTAIDLGSMNRAAAVLVKLPPSAATAAGIAANGEALTTLTLPAGANAQSGPAIIGARIVDNVRQNDPGRAELAAVYLASTSDIGVQNAMWQLAREFLQPVIAPIALVADVAATGGPPPTSNFVQIAPTIGLSRPAADIIRGSFTATAINIYTVGANQTIDLRDRTATQHGNGQARGSSFRMRNCGNGAVMTGGEVIGQQPDDIPWHLLKHGPIAASPDGDWDDNAVFCETNAGGRTYYIENMRFEKSFDGVNPDTDNVNTYYIRGCYFKAQGDDAIEADDATKTIIMEDCLIDSCHMMVSRSNGSNTTTIIRNVLCRMRRQPYNTDVGGSPPSNGAKFTGPWNSAADRGTVINPSGTGAGYCAGWLFKQWQGSSINCRDCLFLIESLPVGGSSQGQWPPGTYSNVKVIYVGPTPWPITNTTPAGVTIVETQDITEWTNERAYWLTQHGCHDGNGDDFDFLHA